MIIFKMDYFKRARRLRLRFDRECFGDFFPIHGVHAGLLRKRLKNYEKKKTFISS